MIVVFRDERRRALLAAGPNPRSIPPDLDTRRFRKLRMLDDATTDRGVRVPPGNRFEKLRGGPESFHSIRVNRQRRLILRWDGGRGEAAGV